MNYPDSLPPLPIGRITGIDEAWDNPKNPNVEILRFLESKSLSVPNASQGMKFDTDKPKWSLLPTGIVAAVVRVLTFGAKKYAPDNWKKIEQDRYYDALFRHVEARRNGEMYDPETKEHHYAHAICCLMFMMWLDLNTGKT